MVSSHSSEWSGYALLLPSVSSRIHRPGSIQRHRRKTVGSYRGRGSEDEPMRTVDSWFTFENRCLLCGLKISGNKGNESLHLISHIKEGYLNEEFELINSHPVGFPGPPIGKQPESCGWCGAILTTYHRDSIHDCKVCPACYKQFQEHLAKSPCSSHT